LFIITVIELVALLSLPSASWWWWWWWLGDSYIKRTGVLAANVGKRGETTMNYQDSMSQL